MLLYDNLEDCRHKLVGTIIYYKGEAVFVKDVMVPDLDAEGAPTGYILRLSRRNTRSLESVPLESPDLNYLHFKLGYANVRGFSPYFYRKPIKQYRQGLRQDQLSWRLSSRYFADDGDIFRFSNETCDMLEGKYPPLENCVEIIRRDLCTTMAFSPTFALNYESVHNDYLIEYKGVKIGYSPDLKNFNLDDKFTFVRESLMEALRV